MHPRTGGGFIFRRRNVPRYCDRSFFFSSSPGAMPGAFLYFQFRGFIVALAAKYKLLIRYATPAAAGRVQYWIFGGGLALARSLSPYPSHRARVPFRVGNFFISPRGHAFTSFLRIYSPFRYLEPRETAPRENVWINAIIGPAPMND